MGKDILDFLSEFATFLQERNFAVSESALAHLLKAVEDAGINITDEGEMISALLVCLAKTGEQVAAIEVLFHKFLLQKLFSPKEKQNEVEKQEKKEKMDAAISDMKKQLESLQRQKAQIKKDMEDREDKAAKKKAFDDCVSDIQEQLENLEKIKERTVSDLKAQKEVEKQAKKKLLDSFTSDVQGQIKGLEKVKEQIRQNLLAAKQSENTLKISKKTQKYFAKLAEEKAPFQKQVEQAKALLSGNEPWSEKQAEKLSRVLMEQAEKCLYNGQFELADAAMEISKELSSAVAKQQKNADMLETEILEAQKETDQQIETAVTQILRGTQVALNAPITLSHGSGQYGLYKADFVSDVIERMVQTGILTTVTCKGTYGRFEILKIASRTKDDLVSLKALVAEEQQNWSNKKQDQIQKSLRSNVAISDSEAELYLLHAIYNLSES